MRTNPQSGIYSGYYRLVESCRNETGRVCHRTMLNTGYMDELNTDQLNLIQTLVTEKAALCNVSVFYCQITNNKVANKYIEEFYNRLVADDKINLVID